MHGAGNVGNTRPYCLGQEIEAPHEIIGDIFSPPLVYAGADGAAAATSAATFSCQKIFACGSGRVECVKDRIAITYYVVTAQGQGLLTW